MYNKKEKYFCAEKAHGKAKKGAQQMKGREESKGNMKNTRKKITKHKSGITLVALVVTTIFSYDKFINLVITKVSSYNQFSQNHKFSNI